MEVNKNVIYIETRLQKLSKVEWYKVKYLDR